MNADSGDSSAKADARKDIEMEGKVLEVGEDFSMVGVATSISVAIMMLGKKGEVKEAHDLTREVGAEREVHAGVDKGAIIMIHLL